MSYDSSKIRDLNAFEVSDLAKVPRPTNEARMKAPDNIFRQILDDVVEAIDYGPIDREKARSVASEISRYMRWRSDDKFWDEYVFLRAWKREWTVRAGESLDSATEGQVREIIHDVALALFDAAEVRYTAQQLDALPTLKDGYGANLKIQTEDRRVWLSRMTVADGAPYDNEITVERLENGLWTVTEEYPG